MANSEYTISVQEARQALGPEFASLSDSQINQIVENVQVLVRAWNDRYQKSIFKGKTAKEMLGNLSK